MTKVHHSGRARAFTLIELLVVIAIIAILAAILFPVFARARENARRSSCQSNAKQMLLGVAQYTQDYDETFPMSWNGENGGTMWAQMIQPYVKNTQLFQCPSDSLKNNNWGSMNFHSSYGMNTNLGSNSSGLALAAVQQVSTTVFLTDLGVNATGGAPWTQPTVKKPAWLLQDPTVGLCPGCATNAGDPNWSAPVDRHLDTTTVGFVDGHVKSMRTEKFYSGNSAWLDPARGG